MKVTIDIFPAEGQERTDVVDVRLPEGSPNALRGLGPKPVRELIELAERCLNRGAPDPTFEVEGQGPENTNGTGITISVRTANGLAVIHPLPLQIETVKEGIAEYVRRRDADIVHSAVAPAAETSAAAAPSGDETPADR